MNRREYLLKILIQLEPIWNLAKGLRILVEDWNLNDDILETLIEAIQWAVHTAKSDIEKEKLSQWLEVLEKMKQMEEESQAQDQKDLSELDNLLDNF